MSRMYGDRINEFVLSVDIMNSDTFHQLLNLVSEYLRDQLNVTYFSVLEAGTVNGEPGLVTLWSSHDRKPSFTVGSDGDHGSFSAYSFATNQPLWVITETDGELAHADSQQFVDHWGGVTDLPAYSASISGTVRTSVMHPMRRGSGPIGVIEFGCPDPVEPTPASKQEVATLADTITRAYRMFDVRNTQRLNTERALRMLEASMTEETWKRLALPQVFVAYSGRGDPEVIETMRAVLERFKKVLRAHYWADDTKSGDINSHVVEAITNSEFGVCYFSEPAESEPAESGADETVAEDGDQNAKQTYADNANVLFEAGMMQALTNSGGALLRGWIPIRENSGSLPFDVASQRMVIVPRADDGKPDRAAFAEDVRKRLATLIGRESDESEVR